jgi:release factor glutamine methyltransferase
MIALHPSQNYQEVRKMRRTERILVFHEQHQEDYPVKFLGEQFELKPNVFCPTYSEGAELLVRSLPDMSGRKVLEMGTGSGVVAIFAAKLARSVVAIDVSPLACECAKHNAILHGVEDKVDIRQGDLFDSIQANENFSLIIYNPPFMDGIPKNWIETAIYDSDYQNLELFFQQAPNYLTSDGEMLIAFSSVGDLKRLESMIYDAGFQAEVCQEDSRNDLEFMVYSCRYSERKALSSIFSYS